MYSDDLDSVTNNLRDSAKGSNDGYDVAFPLTQTKQRQARKGQRQRKARTARTARTGQGQEQGQEQGLG